MAAPEGLAAMGPHAKTALSDLRDVQKAEDKKSKLGKEAGNAIKAIVQKTK